MNETNNILSKVITTTVEAYRHSLGLVLPGACRFHPTCSAYLLEAVACHGPAKGLGLGLWRLLRCHPFHPGGYDAVPKNGTID
jgi:putative membrane protein insertion efficiency factor